MRKPSPKTETALGFARRVLATARTGLRPRRVTHGLAHVCVCVVLLFAWSVPPHRQNFSPSTPATALSEDEIDAALQRAATSALGGREGAVLVMDARTGRLRAVVNSRLAFEEATAPGSTVKVFTELAALRDSLLDAETRMQCRGRYADGGLGLNCSHPPRQPPFNPVQALAYSCNHYFGRVGERLRRETFRQTLASFGFGAGTGADEREAAGMLPRGEEDAAFALGEGRELQVTPVQLLAASAALVNGGHLFAPRRAIAREFTPRERARLEVAPEHRRLLLAGMRGAITYGTASRAGLATLDVHVFGKTGTSTPGDDFRPQGWFIGFAADAQPGIETPPPDSVGLAVLVLLKRARGSDSALAARPIFEAYARLLWRRGVGEQNFHTPPRPDVSTSHVMVRLAREDMTLRLSLDDYVFGVLAAEGSVEDELEALKAQAVVSRTYALRNLRRHARERFDLCSSTHCQRYIFVRDEGRRPEFYELARRAVSETAGEILRDPKGRVAESYFSASCGGATADIASLWGVRAPPAHLRGVRDEFCTGGPHRAWMDVIPRDRLLHTLRQDARSDVGARLDAVRVVRRDRTGRAEVVVVEGERRRVLRGWDLKIIVGRELGWKTLKSSRFEVARRGNDFIFRGAGFGHGLGLCQTGAHVLARRGASYRQILAQYLPGVSIGVAAGGRIEAKTVDESAEQEGAGGLNSDNSNPASQIADSQFHDFRFEISDFKSQFSSRALRLLFPRRLFRVLRASAADQLPGTRHLAGAAVTVRGPSPARAGATRRTMSSEHFRVSYSARTARREVEAALRALEAARADVLRRLEAAKVNAAALQTTAELFVHDTTGDFTAATGQPAWVAATTRGSRIESQPLTALSRRRVLESTLRHEFVHVAAETLARGRAPRWLVEGLAIYVAGEARLLAGDAPRRKPTRAEIERGLERPGSARELRSLYAAAYAEVLALVRREGEAGVWRRVIEHG